MAMAGGGEPTTITSSSHREVILDCAYNFYGNRLATCAADRTIQVWDQARRTAPPRPPFFSSRTRGQVKCSADAACCGAPTGACFDARMLPGSWDRWRTSRPVG